MDVSKLTSNNLVFVYGTLKKGYGNHTVIQDGKGEFIADGKTSVKYPFVNLGAFPALLRNNLEKFKDKMARVKGEVYHVEDFAPLDRLEGAPHFYNRDKINVVMQINGIVIVRHIYTYFLTDTERVKKGDLLTDGIWSGRMYASSK